MSLVELIGKINPGNTSLEGLTTLRTLPKDLQGYDYIPLSAELLEQLPFDPDRPGKAIAMHVMRNAHETEVDATVELIEKQGLLAPGNYAVISPSFPGISLSGFNRKELFVYRTPCRWSLEASSENPFYLESLIKVSSEDAKYISPEARQYYENATNISQSVRNRLNWDEWSYIPPKHLLGRISFSDNQESKYFARVVSQNIDTYSRGLFTEEEVFLRILDQCKNISIHLGETLLEGDAKNLFWKSFVASLTEIELINEIFLCIKGHPTQYFPNFHPSYSWTQGIYEYARTELNF